MTVRIRKVKASKRRGGPMMKAGSTAVAPHPQQRGR